jgi:hypothetical protein
LLGQTRLNRVEQPAIEDRLMLAAMDLATVDDLTDLEAVPENVGERADHKALGGDFGKRSWSRPYLFSIE